MPRNWLMADKRFWKGGMTCHNKTSIALRRWRQRLNSAMWRRSSSPCSLCDMHCGVYKWCSPMLCGCAQWQPFYPASVMQLINCRYQHAIFLCICIGTVPAGMLQVSLQRRDISCSCNCWCFVVTASCLVRVHQFTSIFHVSGRNADFIPRVSQHFQTQLINNGGMVAMQHITADGAGMCVRDHSCIPHNLISKLTKLFTRPLHGSRTARQG